MANISKCENCGADLTFVPGKGTLYCKSCGSNFHVQSNLGKVKRHKYSSDYVQEKSEQGQTQYHCPACGSNIFAGREKQVSICASCGNTNLEKKSSSVYVPDGIVPFEINKERAGEIFLKYVKSRKFAPSDLSQMAKSHKIIGLYAPVWKFDFQALTRYRYIGIKKYLDNDKIEREKEYELDKEKVQNYDNLLLSGNAKLSNEVLNELGEYDFSKAVPYTSEYVLGFYMSDTNKSVHDEFEQKTSDISNQIKNSIENRIRDDYDRIDGFRCKTFFKDPFFNYLAIPVWINHYKYKNKDYHCYINGQTGKTTGTYPKSFWKIFSLVCAVALGIGAIALIISKFIN